MSQESCAQHIIFLSTEQLWHCAMNTLRPKHNSLQPKLDLYWLTWSLAFVFLVEGKSFVSLNLKHDSGSVNNQQQLNNLLRGIYSLITQRKSCCGHIHKSILKIYDFCCNTMPFPLANPAEGSDKRHQTPLKNLSR